MTSAARYDGRDGRVTPYRATPPRWPSVQALPARAALDRALATIGRPPCASEPEAWLSEDPEDREIAAMYCVGCPVMNECHAAGRTEQFGVWGGKDRTRPEFIKQTKEKAMRDDTPPRDVVDGEPEPISREFVQRYSDAFGLGRGRNVLRPGDVIENADGEPIGMTPNEQVPTLLAGMTITPADVKRL